MFYHNDLLTNPWKTPPEEEARLKEQAKTFAVTRLPYRGPRRHAKIQFRQRYRAVAAGTGIAFSDYDRMHVYRHGENIEQWVPEFANSDKDLQLVLAQSAWDYSHQGGDKGRVPNEFVQKLGDLKQLVDSFFEKLAGNSYGQAPRRRIENVDGKMVTSILPCDEQYNIHKTHVHIVKKAGGYLERDAAVAYQTWRLRQNSVRVGEAMGLMPSLVRHILSGLCASARRLGFDALPPRGDHTRGKTRRYRSNTRMVKLPPAEELLQLIESGKTFEQIAEQFNVRLVKSVKGAYWRAKKIAIEDMRAGGATWEEIEQRFGKKAIAEQLCECGLPLEHRIATTAANPSVTFTASIHLADSCGRQLLGALDVPRDCCPGSL